MEPDVLQEFCRTYRRASEGLCNNEIFWKEKYEHDFPDEVIVKARTYKEAYDTRNASSLKLPWTILRAQKAALKHMLIFVPSGTNRTGSGLLSNYKLIENLRPEFADRRRNLIAHMGYRIIGEKDDVIEALRKAHVSEQTIAEILETAITYENYKTEPFATMLNDEIQAFKNRTIIIPSFWNLKRVEAATRHCSLLSPKYQNISIKDLNRVWRIYPTFIIHTGYRIFADPEDIRTTLSKEGIDEATINTVINESITLQNYQTEPFASILREEQERCNKQPILQ